MAVDIYQGVSQGAVGQTTIYTPSAVTNVCPITMVAWVNPLTAVGWGGGAPKILVILDNRYPADVTADSFEMGMTVSGGTWAANAKIRDGINVGAAVSAAISFDDSWHHIAAVFAGSTNQPTSLTAYMDGVAGTPLVNSGGLSPDSLNWTSFGGDGPQITSNQCYRQGCGADVAIYAAVVPADEIAELAAGARPNEITSAPSLLLWLKLTDAASATTNEVGPTYTSSLAPSGGTIGTCATSPPFVPEPPTPSSVGGIPYYIERMDNRIWPTIEAAWCVDSGLRYPMPAPTATLVVSSATGGRNITEYNIINGGSGYTAPIGQIIDLSGSGTGAQVTLSVSSGIIVTATPVSFGIGYTHPELTVLDTTGVGAVIQPIVTNYVTLSATTTSFTASDVGSIVRSGGGKMEITTVSTVTTATANMIVPITATLPNDPLNSPVPVTAGNWTMTAPTTTVSGLAHLAGLTAVALADGGVVTGLVVDEDGSVTLPVEATAITVGLPFVAQLQTMYMDLGGGPTVQTRRKDVSQVVIRVDNSRAPELGLNQPDAAAQPGQAEIPWGVYPYTGMVQVQFRPPSIPAGQPVPLVSMDLPISNVFSTWDERGQIAIQQRDPVPLGVSAIIPWLRAGDSTGQ